MLYLTDDDPSLLHNETMKQESIMIIDQKLEVLAAIIRTGMHEFRKVKAASDQSSKEAIQI